MRAEESVDRPRERARERERERVDHGPGWQVFLNLAEHRQGGEKPFAFLATFAPLSPGRGDPDSKPHTPLGRALLDRHSAEGRSRLEALMAPLERAAAQCRWLEGLMISGEIFRPAAWTVAEAYRLLLDLAPCEEAGLAVRVPDWWQPQSPRRPQIKIQLGQAPGSALGTHALVDFKLSLALGDDELTEAEWAYLLEEAEGLVKLRGTWVVIDREQLNRVMNYWRRAQTMAEEGGLPFHLAMRLLTGAHRQRPGSSPQDGAPELPEREDIDRWSHVTPGPWLEECLARLRAPDEDQESEPDLGATLRPYQKKGLRWLWSLYSLGLGGCLADDMGLGKTVQVIALLLRLKRLGRCREPSLLVVPASLICNWVHECQRFAPRLRVRVVHGSDPEGTSPPHPAQSLDLVITSYGQLQRLPWLFHKTWNALILDEAQAIKNPLAQTAQAAKELRSVFRLALTGTPIENRLLDLWSLFDFACPGLLGSLEDFRALTRTEPDPTSPHDQGSERRHQDQEPDQEPNQGPENGKRREGPPEDQLRQLVSPYLLRRVKTDRRIIDDLPPKTERIVWTKLTARQAALYAAEAATLKTDLHQLGSPPEDDGVDQAYESKRQQLVLTALLRLRQICNHPGHITSGDLDQVEDSGKMLRLRTLAREIAERGEKILVFTQFKSFTGPLARLLSEIYGRPGLVLTGSTPVPERGRLVAAFQEAHGPPFFVLSLKAGGTGLTLTAANHVVHVDRWWNPAVEQQATDRAFRIGQKRHVMVHKMVCQGTIEERIARLLEQKKDLADAVLKGRGQTRDLGFDPLALTNEDLLKLVSLDDRQTDIDRDPDDSEL